MLAALARLLSLPSTPYRNPTPAETYEARAVARNRHSGEGPMTLDETEQAAAKAREAINACRRAIEAEASAKGYAHATSWARYDAARKVLDASEAHQLLALLDAHPSEARPI